MGTPQIILLVLFAMGLLLAANQHSQQRTGKHNFWISFIALSIQLGLLYWGGFFKN